MQIIINGVPDEIAALVLQLQGRQREETASPDEQLYLQARKEAWDKIQSQNGSPPLDR